MEVLTGAGLATLAGVSEAEIARMTDLGVLVPRDGRAPFRVGDLPKLRLALDLRLREQRQDDRQDQPRRGAARTMVS